MGMKNERDWLIQNTSTLSQRDATSLVINQFLGSVLDASYKFTNDGTSIFDDDVKGNDDENDTDVDVLQYLIDEQTPGGLNEQALQNYDKLGGLDEIQQKVMDSIVNRIRGVSDGKL